MKISTIYHSIRNFINCTEYEFNSYVIGRSEISNYKGIDHTLVIPSVAADGTPITKIGDYAFQGCNDLRKVIIPDTVMYIGKGAFSNCKNLKSVTASDNIISIGEDAFLGCDKLKKLHLSAGYWMKNIHQFNLI